MVSLQWTQKKLQRVEGELREKHVLAGSLRKASNLGGWRQSRAPGELTNHRRYEICAQECLYGFVRVVYDRILKYAKLETSELCFYSYVVAHS